MQTDEAENKNFQESQQAVAKSELPFMGHMTLVHRKTKGRKPNKTDICHLISKNYGIETKQEKIDDVSKRTDKTDESFSLPSPLPNFPSSYQAQNQTEPLNLCMKDNEVYSKTNRQIRGKRRISTSSCDGNIPSSQFLSLEAIQKSIEAARLLNMRSIQDFSQYSKIIPCAKMQNILRGVERKSHPKERKSDDNKVTICKYKFIGGSVPSLERKRIFLVDKSGNLHAQKEDSSIQYRAQPETTLEAMNLPAEIINSDNSYMQIKKAKKKDFQDNVDTSLQGKGLLVQTQCLESPQGATFCKFRQLRKFTRYLFRSWKDYLPDHIHNKNRKIEKKLQ